MLCPLCHNENDDEFLFCQHCGKSLKPEQSSGSSQAIDSHHSLPAEAQFCVDCGAPVSPDYIFCSHCGAPYENRPLDDIDISTPRICKVCGSTIEKDHIFCSNCGTPCSENEEDEEDDLNEVISSHRRIRRVDFTHASRSFQKVSVDGFKLVQILDDGSEGESITLHDGENNIGSATIEMLKEDPFVSPKHLKITCINDTAFIEDNNSLNGVFLQLKGSSKTIKDGDIFRIGEVLLSFSFGDSNQPLISFDNDISDETAIIGNEEAPGWGYLHVILGPYAEGDVYRLEKPETTLGRNKADITFPNDSLVSGMHASLTIGEKGAMLTDLNSSNGTFLRFGNRYSVSDSACILIGNHLFKLTKISD